MPLDVARAARARCRRGDGGSGFRLEIQIVVKRQFDLPVIVITVSGVQEHRGDVVTIGFPELITV